MSEWYDKGRKDALAGKRPDPPHCSGIEHLLDMVIPVRGSFEEAQEEYREGYDSV